MRSFLRSFPRAAAATVVIWLASSTTASAQAKFGEVPPPEPRGYTVGWLLAAALTGMAVAAGCRSAYRASKPGDA